MDRILRSWDLLRQSFAILMSDVELLWLPVYSAIATGAASLLLLSGSALVFLPQLQRLTDTGLRHPLMRGNSGMWAGLFIFYVATNSLSSSSMLRWSAQPATGWPGGKQPSMMV